MTSRVNALFCNFIGMIIETIYYKSPLGILRISSEKDAISEIHFMYATKEDNDKIPFPLTGIVNEILKNCLMQLDSYFSGGIINFDIATAHHGTPFQEKVWDELQRIPYGKTISYLQLSKRVGNTKAIRAVGAANGKNNISIVVPCHRVIGSNGSLVGYAGELWRKKWLLSHEAKYALGVQMLFNE